MLRFPSTSSVNRLRRRVAQRAMRLLFGAPALPSREPLPLAGVHRILVCHVSHTLGNALLLTPLLQELEVVYPGAQVDIVTRNPVASALYGRYPGVDRVVSLPAHGFAHPLRYVAELRGLLRRRHDLVIDPDPQSQTGRLLTLMAKGRYSLGFDSARKSGSVTHAVPLADAPAGVGQRAVFLLRAALGRDPAATPCPLPDIRLDERELAQGRELLARLLAARGIRPAPRGVIGVFANATGEKLLGTEWWTRFLGALEPLRGQYDIVEIVPAFGRSLLDARYPSYFSGDLRKLAGVLSALSLYISADCGVMHLANASGAPTRGIFTVTDPDEWGGYGPRHGVLRARDHAPEDVARKVLEPLAGAAAARERNAARVRVCG